MSAFICSAAHIKQLAIFAAMHEPDSMNDLRVDPRYVRDSRHLHKAETHKIAGHYADILYQENVRSVMHRYTDDKRSDYDLHCVVSRADVDSYQAISAVELLKLCACLSYQSCETEDYKTTAAFDLLEQIREAAIYALPGYHDAPWTFEPKEKTRAA